MFLLLVVFVPGCKEMASQGCLGYDRRACYNEGAAMGQVLASSSEAAGQA